LSRMLGRERVDRTHLNVVSSLHSLEDKIPGTVNNDAQGNQRPIRFRSTAPPVCQTNKQGSVLGPILYPMYRVANQECAWFCISEN